MTRTGILATTLAALVLAAAPFAVWANPAPTDRPPAATPPRADPARFAASGVIDLPVRFEVRNANDSLVDCHVDGGTYQLAGHLTVPRDLLDRAERAVTVYQHGIAAGEWYWRLDVPGYHHAEEMARRGHASLTIDRLGYGASDKPDGLDLCVGGAAAMTDQVVRHLRDGTYQLAGDPTGGGERPADPPRFDRVVLAGHSNGGQIAQIATYSYRNVDGLVLMGWTDLGLTDQANARFFSSLQTCLRGGSPVEPGGPAGYAYYDLGRDEFASGNFHDTDPAVLAAALPLQSRHPCGDMVSQLAAVFLDLRRLAEIDVPVLITVGSHDARVTGGAAHQSLFTGAETELVEVPEAGHYLGLERSAPMVHDTLAGWLAGHGW